MSTVQVSEPPKLVGVAASKKNNNNNNNVKSLIFVIAEPVTI